MEGGGVWAPDLGARHFASALGKDGKTYLLDRDDLGGIGGAPAATTATRVQRGRGGAEYGEIKRFYKETRKAGRRAPSLIPAFLIIRFFLSDFGAVTRLAREDCMGNEVA